MRHARTHVVALFLIASSLAGRAGALTVDQLTALRNAIVADPALSARPNTPDDNSAIADALNAQAVPAFYVWRTVVTEAEYTGLPGVDATNANAPTAWSWPAFIARSIGEQNGWSRMFATGSVNPSRVNIRQGFADIFSGGTNVAAAQRAHLIVMSRRPASRAEMILADLAAGNGTPATPATLRFEGRLNYQDITMARGIQ